MRIKTAAAMQKGKKYITAAETGEAF